MTEWNPELIFARRQGWRRVWLALAILLTVGLGVAFVVRYL
jgi:hypothetical protein